MTFTETIFEKLIEARKNEINYDNEEEFETSEALTQLEDTIQIQETIQNYREENKNDSQFSKITDKEILKETIDSLEILPRETEVDLENDIMTLQEKMLFKENTNEIMNLIYEEGFGNEDIKDFVTEQIINSDYSIYRFKTTSIAYLLLKAKYKTTKKILNSFNNSVLHNDYIYFYINNEIN